MSLLKGFDVKLIYNIEVTITRDYKQICIEIEIIEMAIIQTVIMQMLSLEVFEHC